MDRVRIRCENIVYIVRIYCVYTVYILLIYCVYSVYIGLIIVRIKSAYNVNMVCI